MSRHEQPCHVMRRVSSWGRLSAFAHEVIELGDRSKVAGELARGRPGIAHGLGRSYGDACLNPDGVLWRTAGLDRWPDWFAATVGGLGLTGLIVEAELQLRQVPGPWLDAETIAYSGLDEFFRLSEESHPAWEHAVSWIDCTSSDAVRGLFMRAKSAAGEHGTWRERRLAMPLVPPVSLVNRLTLKPLNQLYWTMNKRQLGRRIAHYEPFLFPLDGIRDWNRLYGPAGFYQYQCVVPREAGSAAIREMLEAIARSGDGSVLAVLKTFGDRWPLGLLSFARPGVTLALDFQNRAGVETLFERLDAIVTAAGGRLYPAKDARMPRSMFESGYPRLGEFLDYRDPGMSSAMSRRLMGS